MCHSEGCYVALENSNVWKRKRVNPWTNLILAIGQNNYN